MDESTTQTIRDAFRDYFDPAEIALPEPIPPKGEVTGDGWTVRFVRLEADGDPVLDFFAEHRMTNSRHVRIDKQGQTRELESYQDVLLVGMDDDDEAWNQAKAQQAEHNRRVTEILQEKGLID